MTEDVWAEGTSEGLLSGGGYYAFDLPGCEGMVGGAGEKEEGVVENVIEGVVVPVVLF